LDSSLAVPLITGSGVAGIFCVLFVLGLIFPKPVVTDLKQEILELKQALEKEREASKAAVTAAAATRDIMAAVQLGRDIGQQKAGP
jgi:hypothetical protein